MILIAVTVCVSPAFAAVTIDVIPAFGPERDSSSYPGFANNAAQELRVPDGTLSGDVPAILVPKWQDHVLVVVNGRVAGSDVCLKKGDRVAVLPKMAGG